jgi:hypothetical protein
MSSTTMHLAQSSTISIGLEEQAEQAEKAWQLPSYLTQMKPYSTISRNYSRIMDSLYQMNSLIIIAPRSKEDRAVAIGLINTIGLFPLELNKTNTCKYFIQLTEYRTN